MQNLKFIGVPVFMAGQNYYIPSLSYGDFKANYALLSAGPQESDGADSFERFIPVIGMAIRRNYPAVSDDNLRDWLDLNTLPLAIRAVGAASGMTPVSEGE